VNFRDKLRELVLMAEADEAFAGNLDTMAEGYLEQFKDWPCSTQVPLSRVAHVVAAMLLEPNINIRRIRATDGIQLKDFAG